MNKKQIRERFRDEVFSRDKNMCRICGDKESKLDAHHIENRNLFENGGYVLSNGISLCDKIDGCHMKVEEFYFSKDKEINLTHPYHPNTLYRKIGSNFDKAIKDDKRNSRNIY